jgi:acetolactate synthase-1/2/3 large subunit
LKQKVSDYIADFLVEQGIQHNFTVPGGGAMHLNVSFGNKQGLKNVFVQHEQSAAMAADAYSRANNRLALVCCTTGPGGTNTLTGILGAWLDSIPMLVVSGQVKYEMTVQSTGLPLRSLGDQEFDIIGVVSRMTKYACMVTDAREIKYHLQKALHLAQTGRPGPVWLDIPLNVQAAMIETDDLCSYDPVSERERLPEVSDQQIAEVIRRIREAKRPVLNCGSGIRIAGAMQELNQAMDLLGIPVVTGFNSVDLIETEHPLYVGRAGVMGDRAGNWAVQNSDLVLSVGSRLSIRQVGFDAKTWAREAFVIMVDADEAELKKPTIHVEMPIQTDARLFLQDLVAALEKQSTPKRPLFEGAQWLDICARWKREYPVVTSAHSQAPGRANLYYFMDVLSRALPKDSLTISGNGSACVASSQAFFIQSGQRFVINSGAASMGYDLPAAIGACFATGRSDVVCLSGDGSIQMNLQELQTIVHHRLPIKIFLINNEGYHSMRQTQDNLFPELPHVGIGPETGDLSFPQMKRIAEAYGIPYMSAHTNAEVPEAIEKSLATEGFVLCEIFATTDQKFEPKSATKKHPDGRLTSPPLEDLAPFLPREELESVMIIPLLGADA